MAIPFEVTLLGVNSAIPVFGRHPSSQIVRYDDTLLMIDCGEGTQSQLSTYRIKRSKIDHIFISHLHGDHCFGLPGFLTTSSLQQRNRKLILHGPKGIKEFINVILNISESFIGFDLQIIEYNTAIKNAIPINPNLEVSTFPLQHRVPTMGFRVQETEVSLNMIPGKIKEYKLTIEEIKLAKRGIDIERGTRMVPSTELVKESYHNRAYAYVSDSIYDESLIPYLEGVSTLYHETTYLDDLKHFAKDRMHSTISDAVKIAKLSKVNKLITGHYSSRYKDISIFLKEGKKLWDRVELGIEGNIYTV